MVSHVLGSHYDHVTHTHARMHARTRMHAHACTHTHDPCCVIIIRLGKSCMDGRIGVAKGIGGFHVINDVIENFSITARSLVAAVAVAASGSAI